jgi:hypothetical protein
MAERQVPGQLINRPRSSRADPARLLHLRLPAQDQRFVVLAPRELDGVGGTLELIWTTRPPMSALWGGRVVERRPPHRGWYGMERLPGEGAIQVPLMFDDLSVDVFEVAGCGLTVESLTGGHGMTETGASCQHRGIDSPTTVPCSCYQA